MLLPFPATASSARAAARPGARAGQRLLKASVREASRLSAATPICQACVGPVLVHHITGGKHTQWKHNAHCKHAHTHACAHTHARKLMHTCTHACTCTRTCTRTRTHAHAHTHTHTRAHPCTRTRTRTLARARAGSGRGLVAAHDVHTGGLLLACEPLVYAEVRRPAGEAGCACLDAP